MTKNLEDLVVLDIWENMLQSLEPEYQNLVRALETGPTIKPILSRKGRWWQLTLKEIWFDNDSKNIQMLESSKTLDDIVEWSEKELEKYKDCRRTAWDQWQFRYKHDAEKFITLFTLKWAEV